MPGILSFNLAKFQKSLHKLARRLWFGSFYWWTSCPFRSLSHLKWSTLLKHTLSLSITQCATKKLAFKLLSSLPTWTKNWGWSTTYSVTKPALLPKTLWSSNDSLQVFTSTAATSPRLSSTPQASPTLTFRMKSTTSTSVTKDMKTTPSSSASSRPLASVIRWSQRSRQIKIVSHTSSTTPRVPTSSHWSMAPGT